MTRRFLAALAAVSALTIPSQAGEEPARRLRVVVFGGHPDDPESGAGGLVALLTRQGHEVILAYGTTFLIIGIIYFVVIMALTKLSDRVEKRIVK